MKAYLALSSHGDDSLLDFSHMNPAHSVRLWRRDVSRMHPVVMSISMLCHQGVAKMKATDNAWQSSAIDLSDTGKPAASPGTRAEAMQNPGSATDFVRDA